MNNNCPEESAMGSEFWHTYAKDDKACPDTWDRELEEWQFDGITEEPEDVGISKKSVKRPGSRELSPMQQELAKWLPAT